LHRAFKGVYGAWVNTDGFTLGEKNELFYGCRAYEIARYQRVQHYVYACTDFALKHANWDENYHWGHNDAKGRVAEYILAQGQDGMKTSVLTTGPYMNMLWDGMFVPTQQPDGTFVWVNPASKSLYPTLYARHRWLIINLDGSETGKIPLIALEDIGHYSLWLFNNLPESAGMNLKVATDEVSFADIAAVFTEVTGKKGVHQYMPLEEYLPLAEPFPGALANFAAGPNAVRDDSTMTWRQNFSVWWRYWGEGRAERRDFTLLNRIHPGRIKSLGEWMKMAHYDGSRKNVLKGAEDLKRAAAMMQNQQTSASA
jgi:hypothetical protein